MKPRTSIFFPLCLALLPVVLSACSDRVNSNRSEITVTGNEPQNPPEDKTPPPAVETITLGAGCFWCIEAVLEQIDGISDVTSGYMGGAVENPTYEQICTGLTGHAEVVQVTFDPKVIDFAGVLEYFWKLHDPTTLNRQGNDVGTQYRSAIFYHNEEQRSAAKRSMEKFDNSGEYSNPIVTEITTLDQFWPAEDYHNNYYDNNPNQPYCRIISKPKLDKLFMDK